MLMTAHVVFSALDATVPATLSRHVMTTLLREEIGYRGVVVSDDLDMRAIAAHHGVGNAAIAAIRAGCDAILLCRDQAHQGQAEAALISEARADAGFATMIAVAAERVRAMKRAHEALQASVPVEPHSIGCEAHQALATQLRQ
jgi:beta-N-acetylhexosaminidase